MKKGGMGAQVSYNIQTAVDTEHKLIIAHDVTNAPVDRNQLFPIAGLAQHTLKQDEMEADHYRCPAGEILRQRFNTVENGMTIQVYFSPVSVCRNCKIKLKCTTSSQRRIRRWEHEGLLDSMEQELRNTPDAMTIRSQTVEHPFGTLKAWMGSTHFLMRRLKNVRTEMSLHVLAYNLRRMISIMGAVPLIEAMRA